MEFKSVIFVDIDETICFYENQNSKTKAGKREYERAVPDMNNIQKINKLFLEGNRIVYWTARGSRTGLDWYDLTEKQLKSWGAKYHELRCDKPYYDMFIDDKSLRIGEVNDTNIT